MGGDDDDDGEGKDRSPSGLPKMPSITTIKRSPRRDVSLSTVSSPTTVIMAPFNAGD